MKRRPVPILILAAAALALPSLASAQFTGFAGTVMVDMVEVQPGASFGVDVRLVGNDISIAAMQLPLRFESPYLTLDSVSYAGSLKPGGMTATARIDNVSDTVAISYFPDHTVFPVTTFSDNEGVLATLYFTVSPAAPDGPIPIDSVSHGSGLLLWSGIGFSDADGLELKTPAGFVAGEINVSLQTAVDDELSDQLLPTTVGLSQNYPNPFNPTTTIEFALPRAGHIKLEVYNILGQKTAVLFDGPMSAGTHQIEFDASATPSGIYFYRLMTETEHLTRKMILVK